MTIEDLSLVRGGPTYRATRALARHLPGVRLPGFVSILLVAVAFMPLLVLCGRDGTLHAGYVAMPLLGDWVTMFCFFVAMPLLVLAVPGAEARLRAAIFQLFRSDIVAARDRARFGAVLDGARRARDSAVPELACLVLALLPLLARRIAPALVQGTHATLHSWRFAGDGQSAAGQWSGDVSAPLFRFVVLLWLWRFALWPGCSADSRACTWSGARRIPTRRAGSASSARPKCGLPAWPAPGASS